MKLWSAVVNVTAKGEKNLDMAQTDAVCVLLISLMASGVLGFYLDIFFPEASNINYIAFDGNS